MRSAYLLVLLPLAFRQEPAPATINIVTNVTTAAAPAPVISVAAPPAANRPSCPPPRTDAPPVTPKLDEQVEHVQPAPSDAGWIAAWNDHHVFVSYDAGATFQRALDGDDDVRDASFDCWGHLIVLRGSRVGVRDGARDHWREVTGILGAQDDPRAVLGGGPDIVVVGRAPGEGARGLAAISADTGATWRYHDAGQYITGERRLRGRQEADGKIEVAAALEDCMNDDLVWTTIEGDDVSTTNEGIEESTSFGLYGDVIVTDWGWRTRRGEWHQLDTRGAVSVVPGAFPVLVIEDKTYRFENGHLRALPLVVEGEPQAVDAAGRVWSIACGKPLVARRAATGALAACSSAD